MRTLHPSCILGEGRRPRAVGGEEVVRYYVLETSEDPKVKMFIVAEVVHELDESSEDRGLGIAGQIAGGRALILSGAEVMILGEGARILREWQEGDDERYDEENVRIHSASDSEIVTALRHLRLLRGLREESKEKNKNTEKK